MDVVLQRSTAGEAPSSARLTPAGDPAPDHRLHPAGLAAALTELPASVTTVVVAGRETPETTGDRMAAIAGEGRVAVRGVVPTDAVKRLGGGRITATLDRRRMVVARVPLASPRHLLERVLRDRGGGETMGVAELLPVTGAEIVFVDATGTPLATLDDPVPGA